MYSTGPTGSIGPLEINICKNIMKKELENTNKKNETLYAYAIVSECYDLIMNSKNLVQAFISIQEETTLTKNILLSSNEYVFGYEMFPTKEQLGLQLENTIVNGICVFHNNAELVNKSTILGQEVLHPFKLKWDT